MTNTTNAAVAQKATKVTIMSILYAAAPVLVLPEGQAEPTKDEAAAHKANVAEFVAEQSKQLATYFINKSSNLDLILAIVKGAVKAVPAVLTEIEAEKKAAEEQKALDLQKQAEIDKKAAEEEEARLKTEKDEMLKKLLELVDPETAAAMVEAGMKKKKAAASTGKGYDRVNVTVGEKSFDVPVRGNMSQEVKDLIATEFGNVEGARDLFIAKYRTTPAETVPATETAE